MPVLGRKVGAAEEGLQLGGKPDAHRPPAASREALHIGHVKPVDIGTLLAIDLHVDEVRVHHPRDLRTLEGLMGHHMAPVAGRIADREKDRLPLATRPGERLLTPGIPLHGILRMLEEVGGGGGGELVHKRISISRRGAEAQRMHLILYLPTFPPRLCDSARDVFHFSLKKSNLAVSRRLCFSAWGGRASGRPWAWRRGPAGCARDTPA